MSKYTIPLIAGLVVSYCFASMILNTKIVNPVLALQNRALVLGWNEISQGMKDFEIVSENQLRSTSNNAWIEIENIRERIGKLYSVVYKVKPIEQPVVTTLYYADTKQKYLSVRSLTASLNGDTAIVSIPDSVGLIDKLRLDLANLSDITFEIEEISLNTDMRFSAPMMAFIYVLWCMVVFLDFRTPDKQ